MSQPSSSGSGNSGSGSKGFVAPSVGDLDAVLDAYEFIEILGQGGMGAVYKARQRNLDRMVAIKILPRLTVCPTATLAPRSLARHRQ